MPQVRNILHGPRLQAKLKVGAANDPLEREADRVADAVMRMPDPGPVGAELQPSANTAPSSAAPPTLRRLCTECEDELRRKEDRPASVAPDAAPPIVHDVLRGPGRPLDAATRNFMEHRFGTNLSHVRVHNDARATESAKAVEAEAYTVGQNIAFAHGAYQPESNAGKRLIAHELTHVIQQKGRDRPDGDTVLRPYRKSGTPNFQACDTATLNEESFPKKGKDQETVPWIKDIFLHFDDAFIDSDGDLTASGSLKAVYSKNKATLPDLSVRVSGGSADYGLSDTGSHTVGRIEGCGYNRKKTPPDPADRLSAKGAGRYYHKPAKKDLSNMSFAVFFTNVQAIHVGSLDTGSLSCAHVENDTIMQQINYHTVSGKTKVHVTYDASALVALCCQRYFATGRMVSNPCGGQSKRFCDASKKAVEAVGRAAGEVMRTIF